MSPNANSFYENYNNIKKTIEYLETKTFRTTEKDEELKKFIKDNNYYNCDILLDVIFNLIYSQLLFLKCIYGPISVFVIRRIHQSIFLM